MSVVEPEKEAPVATVEMDDGDKTAGTTTAKRSLEEVEASVAEEETKLDEEGTFVQFPISFALSRAHLLPFLTFFLHPPST